MTGPKSSGISCFSGIITVPGFFSGIITLLFRNYYCTWIVFRDYYCTWIVFRDYYCPPHLFGDYYCTHFRDYYYPPNLYGDYYCPSFQGLLLPPYFRDYSASPAKIHFKFVEACVKLKNAVFSDMNEIILAPCDAGYVQNCTGLDCTCPKAVEI
jgi:hypothetical protein